MEIHELGWEPRKLDFGYQELEVKEDLLDEEETKEEKEEVDDVEDEAEIAKLIKEEDINVVPESVDVSEIDKLTGNPKTKD